MIIFIDFLNWIVYFIYTYFFFLLLKSFLPMRDSKIIKFIGYLLCGLIAAVIIYPNDLVNAIGALFLFILYMFLFHKGTWYTKISCVIIFYPIIISLNYLTENCGLLIWQYSGETMTLLSETILHTVTLSFRIPFWFLIYHFCKKLISDTVQTLTPQAWLIMDAICFTSFIGILTVICYAPGSTYFTYPACIANMVACFGCIYLSVYIAKTIKTDMELQNLKYQQSYYEELEQNQQNIRKIRHDMRNHLSVIGSFFQNEDTEQAKSYFQKLSDEFTVTNRVFCQNSIVNAVINGKYNLAVQNHIDCFFNIDIGELLGIDDVSICSLFANTLDNAIEANLKIPDLSRRSLSVKARYYHGFFSYEISNARENEIITKNGRFITEKPDKKSHGFGLRNVRNIIDKYNGNMDISYTDTSFTITILIGNI